MEFKPNNLYKLHLNNQNNIISGVGTSKFTLDLPSYFPKGKQCYIYVEQAQVQIKDNNGDLTQDFYSVNSNLISQNSCSNNNKSQTGTLCVLSPNRITGQSTNNQYIELINPTEPVLIGFMPNQIELFISNVMD